MSHPDRRTSSAGAVGDDESTLVECRSDRLREVCGVVCRKRNSSASESASSLSMDRWTASPYQVSVGSRVNTVSRGQRRRSGPSHTVVLPLPSSPSSVTSILTIVWGDVSAPTWSVHPSTDTSDRTAGRSGKDITPTFTRSAEWRHSLYLSLASPFDSLFAHQQLPSRIRPETRCHALSRSPEDATLPDGVETVAGDVTDYGSIESAFEGQDAVYYLVALSPLFKPDGGDKMHERIHLGGTENSDLLAARACTSIRPLLSSCSSRWGTISKRGRKDRPAKRSGACWTGPSSDRRRLRQGRGVRLLHEAPQRDVRAGCPAVSASRRRKSDEFQPIWVGDLVPMPSTAPSEEHVGEAYEIGARKYDTGDVTSQVYDAEGRR